MTSDSSSENTRVLVVDDDETVRVLIRMLLEEGGFAVEEAADGREALDQFQAERPAVVLMDVMMPGMDGFETCSEIRSRPGGELTPVILLTGLEDNESINRAYDVGATDFINKPINGGILVHRIRYVLRGSQLLQQLWESESRLAAAQRMAQVGNWELNLRSRELTASDEFRRLLGLKDAKQVSLEDFLSRVHPEDRQLVENATEDAIHEGKPYDITFRLTLPDGAERFVRGQAEVQRDRSGEMRRVLATVQDISEIKQAEDKIQHLAYYDVLTGLANRALFKDRLNHILSHARRNRCKFALMFLDVDRFKRINDTLGHDVGDLLLQEIAERMLGVIRDADAVGRLTLDPTTTSLARLGGDKFTILLNHLTYVQDAAKVASRILEVVSQPFSLNGHEVVVTASIGVAVYPMDGETVEQLLKHADTAMYHTKDQGRNNYHFFSPSMNKSAFERLMLENDLRRGLKDGELVLHYQPQVDLQTGKVSALEGLVRWNHPGLGVVTPDKFLQLAEESGLVVAIDEWVLREACCQAKEWESAGLSFQRIAVNISNRSFDNPGLITLVRDALKATRLDPARLELELTEGIVMENVDAAIERLRELKRIGVKLSIDDFGTGYSSLSHLKLLPVDALKIDRSFIRDLCTDPGDAAIVRAILALGQHLRKRIVAEGIEDDDQLEFLRDPGCDEVQGYYFSRPRPAEQIQEILRDEVVVPAAMSSAV